MTAAIVILADALNLAAGIYISPLKLQEDLLLPHPVKRTKRTRGVSSHNKIVDIACGSYASYAVDEVGNTWAWGLNNYGQVGMQGQVKPSAVLLHFGLLPTRVLALVVLMHTACIQLAVGVTATRCHLSGPVNACTDFDCAAHVCASCGSKC